MNLENINVSEINLKDQVEISGGGWPKWAKGLGWGYLASQVIENWEDIKSGFNQGYNAGNH